MRSRNWTYVRMLAPDFRLLDQAVVRLSNDASFAQRTKASPWFFLRFVEVLGPQLRLRVLLDEDDRMDFVEWAQGWYADLVGEFDESDLGNVDGPVPGRIGFDVCSYRPEIEKYGSIAAVERIEDLWAPQSQTALQAWSGNSSRQLRTGLWAIVAHDTMQALFGPVERHAVASSHAEYWLSRFPTRQSSQQFISTVGALLERFDSVDDYPNRTLLSDGLITAMRDLDTIDGSVGARSYSFNLLHILANRLGLSPLEEGLAMLAVDHYSGRNQVLLSA